MNARQRRIIKAKKKVEALEQRLAILDDDVTKVQRRLERMSLERERSPEGRKLAALEERLSKRYDRLDDRVDQAVDRLINLELGA